jgi:hypothetical protein
VARAQKPTPNISRSNMAQNKERKPKLTDAERHKRFLEEARRAEASDDPKDFDTALKKIARSKGGNSPGSPDQKS